MPKDLSDYVPLIRNQYITFAKAYAIITIVLYHFSLALTLPSLVTKTLNLGGGGVHLFIFASGFGLYLSKYINFKTFIKKRFLKVIIPYYLTVTLIFIFNLVFHIFPDGIPAFLSHIFFYKMFIEKFKVSFGGQFWFISTIIQLYLFFPLLLIVVRKYNSLNCLLISLFISFTYAIVVSIMGYDNLRVVNSFFLQYLWEFILGMIIAKEGLISRITYTKWYISLIIGIVSYAIMAFLVLVFGSFGRNINDLFSFIGYFSISVFIFNLIKNSKRALALTISLEAISYSLFLTHTFVYTVFVNLIFHNLSILHLSIVFVTALIIATLFNYFINKVMLIFPLSKSNLIKF